MKLLDTQGLEYLRVRKPEDIAPCVEECWLTFPHHHFGEVVEMCYVGQALRLTEKGLCQCACEGGGLFDFREASKRARENPK